MPSNQTSVVPGGSVSEPRGAIGLQTAKLSPILGNVTDATAQLPAPVQSGGRRHPYSNMAAADFDAEATGTLGLTAVELALVGNEYVMLPITKPQRLLESTITRRGGRFTVQDEQRAKRAEWSLLLQERRDEWEAREASEAAQPTVEASYNGKRARGVKLPKPTFALRRNKQGALERRPSFSDCECPMCAMREGQVATDDKESATRKPILSGASSRDVRPVVSTADAKLLVPTGSITLELVPTGYDQPLLSPTEGGARLVNDNGLSMDDNHLVYSNVLEWRPQPYRELPVDGLPHDQDTGGYLSDDQPPSDSRRLWHGKAHPLSINRGLCIPSHHIPRATGERILMAQGAVLRGK